MKLNTKIVIQSVYDEEQDINSISSSADLNMTAGEFLTTLKLAENSVLDLIKNFAPKKDIDNWLKTVTLKELYNKQN